jgi:4-hydroxybenzoate polyprenyltransferase
MLWATLAGLPTMISALFKSSRPHQWIKNIFVAAPLVFARKIDDLPSVLHTLIVVLGFCLISSAVYLWNDIADVEKDRNHPLKRLRPIASGQLSVKKAQWAVALFATIGISLTLSRGWLPAGIAAAYLLQNLAYSLRLKHVPFIDVASIATGFLLRVLAGAAAIPVEPSFWLLACTGLLASLLGFGKRAHELRIAGQRGGTQRRVLERYDPRVLRALILLLAGLTIIVYAGYTQSEHAISSFGTRRLILTLPFVIFGVYRFVGITQNKIDSESPTDSMLRDAPFLINLLGYATAVIAILYTAW